VGAIGNYRAFTEAAVDDALINKIVQGIAGAKHSLAEIDSELDAALDLINTNVPFTYPFLVKGPHYLTLWRMRNRICVPSPDMALIHMITGEVM
jgi:hypothetical protein